MLCHYPQYSVLEVSAFAEIMLVSPEGELRLQSMYFLSFLECNYLFIVSYEKGSAQYSKAG